ncbi:MAG: DUF6048 family protein [Mesonia sp.]|uniref:DUF6048 family protein n=1 Tax=Mesonia sp. TaxID=1960830 RepID=UPI003F99BB11
MNLTHISIFIISFLGVSLGSLQAQNSATQDSTVIKEKFGIRVGADLSKAITSIIDEDYKGFEIFGDYRVYKNYYAAAEIGIEEKHYTEPYLDGTANGSYIKIGANYNAYKNWLDMQNEIFVGVRYGFASFSQTLNKFAIYSNDSYFPVDIRETNQEFKSLNASWGEVQGGLKTEVLNNLFLSVHVQLKIMISDKKPDNFDNLYIPGFHRTYGGSSIGVGWGYSLSYLIPVVKKAKVLRKPE